MESQVNGGVQDIRQVSLQVASHLVEPARCLILGGRQLIASRDLGPREQVKLDLRLGT